MSINFRRSLRYCSLPVLLGGFAALFCAGALLAADGANLEEKMKYERSLEQKVEDVLANLLGPGKSRVMIRATVDFSTRESYQPEGGKAAQTPEFQWQNINKKTGPGAELLPGFSADSKKPESEGGGGAYQREVIFPQSMVKRLTVSLVLSDRVPEDQAQKVKLVVSNLLALDQARGDEILLMRAAFAPVWYTSEMLGTLVKYGIIAIIAIFGMGIVAIGFLRMASAMRAMGGGDSKISMEMTGASDLPGLGAVTEEPLSLAAPDRPEKASPQEKSEGDMIFDIKEDKLSILVSMLAKDEPADIALIAVHLPEALRPRFISMLPPASATEVMASIAKVRFVEPEMIARIKDELERRLNGAVGGMEKAVQMLDQAGMKAKLSMLKALAATHPEVAASVRSHIMLMDDLDLLEPNDFGIVASAVSVETWSAAAWRLTEGGRARLKAQLTERAWKAVEEAAAFGAIPDEKMDAAAEKVISAALGLMKEGRIKRPAGKAYLALPALSQPGPAAKADTAV